MHFHADADGWIEIRESLQSVSVRGPAVAEIIEITRPLRFGSHWLKVRRGDEFEVKRFYPTNADGSIGVSVHCEESPELQRRLAWLRQAGQIVAGSARQTDAKAVAELLEQTRTLAASAADASDAALALHLAAQVLLMNERYADAAEAFARAEAAWNRAGDANGALAAHLGRVATLYQTGNARAIVELTQSPADVHEDKPYLFVRLEHERCVALQILGRLDDAEKCYEWTLAQYGRLREHVEAEVERQTYASLRRDRGDFAAAQRLGEQGVRDASGPGAAEIRGRNLLMLADLALRRGEIAQSLRQLDAALEEFTALKSAHWQADVYMKLADLYGEIGSFDEAYAALGQAVARFSGRDAPARLATATLSFADLEHRGGHATSAMWWSRVAEQMFRNLDMPGHWDRAQIVRVSAQLDGGSTDPATLAIPPEEEWSTDDAGEWRINRARLALARGDADAARAELRQLGQLPLSLSDRTRATILSAEVQAAGGDAAAAQHTLLDGALSIRALARRAHNEVLRYVIERQDEQLRAAGIRLALAHGAGAATDVVWQWLALQADDDDRGTPTAPAAMASPRDDAFDRAVAKELLVDPGAGTRDATGRAAQRELLARLAGPNVESRSATAGTRVVSIAQFQATLAPETMFIAYVDGATGGALLCVTRDEVRLLPAASPERLRSEVTALQAAVKGPATALGDIQAAARQLSTDLLGGLESTAPPRHLFVFADALSRRIPWSVVPWPGRSEALVESTATTTLRLSVDDASGAAHTIVASTQDIRVVVSAQQNAAGTPLPGLVGATVEAAQIRLATARSDWHIVEDAQATREIVDDALATSGGWVHVAAHGVAQPQRIGYAGLWLEPKAPDTTPAFLSWIDVLDRGVRNDLVVLDACQTGDSGTAVNGNLSFADAVSRAGARNVVAVMWPVSDAASAVWVPAFYAALAADPDRNVADALRAAQQRLRATRAFGHPFYWAGMQSIERWRVRATPAH